MSEMNKYPAYVMLPLNWRYRINSDADFEKAGKLFIFQSAVMIFAYLVAIAATVLWFYFK